MSLDYQTGSPLNKSTSTGTASAINTGIISFAYVANTSNLFSPVSTLSPLINSIHSSRVAVVSPLLNNTVYSPVIMSSPVLNNSNIVKKSTPKGKSSLKSFEDDELLERKSMLTNKSNSSLLSNGSLDDSDIDRFSLVGYNTSPPTRPCGRDNKAGWYEMHERHVELASRLKASVVLCGDSIIAGLSRYSAVWNKHFKPWNALNCGIGGDQTQHVLWRMENMVLPLTVKYIVIHCGTNNIDKDSPQEIANGVISCGLVLQENNPELKIIITGLLPRDLENTIRRHKIAKTNKFLKQYCQQFSNFMYMKQDDDWIHEGGSLNEELYYSDHLHLIESGNHKFANSIIDMLNKISNGEEIIYSDDEDDREMRNCKFERKHGETRNNTPKKDEVIYKSPYKLVRSSTISQKRKRSSPVKTPELPVPSLKKRKTESSLNNRERLKSNDSTPIISITTRKKLTPNCDQNKDVKTEFHGQFNLTKELKHDKLHNEILASNEPLAGTAKSIDISLTDEDRRAARRAKFGISPPTTGSLLRELSDKSKASIRRSSKKKH